jgi:Major capsid protein Gp23
MKQLNEQQIVNKWSPMIESATGLKDRNRLVWLSKYAHIHALNNDSGNELTKLYEAAMGGVSSPYATLYNVPGVGTAQPATVAATTGAQFSAPTAKGSGDKWPALLPMALQVAARTIGFDLVNVVPMPGPTGVVSYLDYVYAGGKQPFGAQPAYYPGNANPSTFQGSAATGQYEAPKAFKVQLDASFNALVTAGTVTVGTLVDFNSNAANASTGAVTLKANYIGKSRIDGFPMFRVSSITSGKNLADVFQGADCYYLDTAATALYDLLYYPSLISSLEDQVQGFVGAGQTDNDNWEGTFVSGTTLYEPMERGVGEMEYPRAMGLQVFTKFVQVGTFQVSVSVTQEQIQDLNKQWGIDVIAMVENAGINEISQAINKHILSRLFAHGWKNHIDAYNVEGINLNMNCASTGTVASPAYAYNYNGAVTNASMNVLGFKSYASVVGATFENQDTMIKRVMALILLAGNIVMQRGRRGPANFIVTNSKIATSLQTNAGYTFSPITNTFTQSNGSLYPLGTIAGMTLYVDPNMLFTDTRVLVGRKGAADEPGVVFCPYLMAESVKLITEGTGAPKVIIKTRYALVDAGFHPQTQYLTLYFYTTAGGIL